MSDTGSIEDFRKKRRELMDLMLFRADINMKRYVNLDSAVYSDGSLPRKTKELMGLVASTVLRCDDCINYHLDTCRECGVTDEELIESLDIALIVGGSITIPHIRRALGAWEEMR